MIITGTYDINTWETDMKELHCFPIHIDGYTNDVLLAHGSEDGNISIKDKLLLEALDNRDFSLICCYPYQVQIRHPQWHVLDNKWMGIVFMHANDDYKTIELSEVK